MLAAAAAAVLAALAMTACQPISPAARVEWPLQAAGSAPVRNLDDSCVQDPSPATDYFPQKLQFTRSTQLSVDYGPNYKRLHFRPAVNPAQTQEFLFVQCGTPVPEHDAHTVVVQVPVRRIVTGNISIHGALDELGLVDRLAGTQSLRSISVPSIQARVAQGLVHEVGGDAHGSIEGIIAIAPEVFLTFYSAYPEANMHPQLQALGVRAIPQADHHEPHPLGRAEWLKLLALMTNRESAGQALFDRIEARYAHIAAIASTAPSRPLVMGGFAAGRDSFEIFGGANQRARLIADAGGRPIAHDRHPGSFVLAPFEAIYARGIDAPVWLGAAPGSASVEHLIARNALNGWFRASREAAVFAWDRGYAGAWQFPSNEVGMTRPHVFLNEAVRALHPALTPLLPPVDSQGFIRQLP